MLPTIAGAQEPADSAPSYEFLKRQADLLFSYKKYDEAADSLVHACGTDEGKVSRECHSRLGNAAEKAGRVGLAIHAWELASVLGEEAQREALGELDRLYSTYGRLLLYPPAGRELPTRPMPLAHTGFLIDPKQKETLSALIDRTGRKGLDESTVWLPFGDYTLGNHTFEITAGEAFALVLDPEDVPFQAGALTGDDAGFVALGGPGELFVGAYIGVGAISGNAVGVQPLGLGGLLTIGRHFGPLRLEARVRVSGVQSKSPSKPEDISRTNPGVQVLGGIDAGVDVRLGGGAWLTPHLSVLGGRVGSVVTGCVAVQPSTEHRYAGECSLGAAGVGGALGVDLLVLPAGDPRRLGLRIGLGFEAVGGAVVAAEGASLVGLGAQIESVGTRGFVRLGGGLDVGLALRF